MRRVIIESPFAASDLYSEKEHLRYVRAAMKDCLYHGEAPFASHALYTQDGVLFDGHEAERKMGMEAGVEWYRGAQAAVVYVDYGISRGMQFGIERADAHSIPVEFRRIMGWKKIEKGLEENEKL
jgi:hypothetical protein